MPLTPSGADTLANTLFGNLTAGVSITLPTVDLSNTLFTQPGTTGPIYGTVAPVNIDELTTGTVGGAGVFDKLMTSLVNHLKVEFSANRISGAEYTKAYIGVITAALQTAAQFVLTKDQVYWQALLAQAQAKAADAAVVQARVDLETARTNLARAQYEALTVEANYALTKMKLSTEDVTYTNAVKQGANIEQQTSNLQKQGVGIDYTNTNMLPAQLALLNEQTEVQRAQTQNTRTSGATIVGMIGKQKDLLAQQIISYQRDAETKAAKLWTDAYITRLTIVGGGTSPNEFNNTNIDEVLLKLKNNLDLK